MVNITTGRAYKGIPVVCDGSEIAAYVETNIAEFAAAYPITPSSGMGALFQQAVAEGKHNLWGTKLEFLELESEHSSASACEGAASGGLRVVNFTSGQGLVLMKEVLYPIAGKGLPVVFHVGARALTVQSLNIHCGHDDVMACADCGWGMLFARNVQDVADLALIARLTAEQKDNPFMVVQDGFLTTHTLQTALLPEEQLMKDFIGDPKERNKALLDPENPLMVGTVQNQDSYMKGRVAIRDQHATLAAQLKQNMDSYSKLTGRHIGPVIAYKCEDAEFIVISMGTISEICEIAVDHLRKNGIKAGSAAIVSFRPFPSNELCTTVMNARAISVIERTDNALAQSNPLTCEVKSALYEAGQNKPTVFSGIAGLGSREITPEDICSVFDNMKEPNGRQFFTLGVDHVSALKRPDIRVQRPGNSFFLRGHSIGGFGSITTNKILAKLLGSLFPKYHIQAYPKYGSEKRSLPTSYFLSIAEERLRLHNEPSEIDFVAIHDPKAFLYTRPLVGLTTGGTVFIQGNIDDLNDVWGIIPERTKKIIDSKKVDVYLCDTAQIAREIASRKDLVTRMQGIVFLGVFLKTASLIKDNFSSDKLMTEVEQIIKTFFAGKSDRVVEENLRCISAGYNQVTGIKEWIDERL